MKAHFVLIAISIILLPTIYFIFEYEYPILYAPPLLYVVYAFIVGTISAFRKR